jgi:dephospho-CoA kinase
MDAMPRIGLTGGIGSGKSTLARMLADRGAGLVDSDAIARELTAPGGAALGPIRAEFGPSFFGGDGALDRVRLRHAVFSDAGRRRRLEALLHPMIRERGERLAGQLASRCSYLLYDVPLLAESAAADGRFERVLVVDCPVGQQVARVMQRGSLRREEVLAIVAGQAGRRERLAIADDVVFNGGDLARLERHAQRLHELYRTLGRSATSV